MAPQRIARRAIVFFILSSAFCFAQNAKSSGTVAPNRVEFRIPLAQPGGGVWNWNRAETLENECEYMWQVAVRNGRGRYSFGFYLYKFPGAKPAHGDLQALFKAGQASVFQEDLQGRGEVLENARLQVSAEDGRIVLRLTDADLIRRIFDGRPQNATINTRALNSDFEVVKIEYQTGSDHSN